MVGTWSVYLGDRQVGTCRIWREGLYYRFSCRCERMTEGICRLLARCGDVTVDLGILVPVDGGFGLDRKLAVRNMPVGEPLFSVKIPGGQSDGIFIPVREGECFPWISRLKDARFGEQGGELGVFLRQAY